MREAEQEFAPPRLADGGEVPYLGERLTLAVRVEPGRVRAHVARRGNRLEVRVGAPGAEALRDALERWYRRRARVEIGSRLDEAVARAGTPLHAVCRSAASAAAGPVAPRAGAMSFNWRLLLAPSEILEYVVEHEVAHLEVHDHSERFWDLLASRSADWERHEAWLRRHGHSLRL